MKLLTRNGHDWTNRMPRLAARFLELSVQSAMIDGELVALRPDGTDSFHKLQLALSEGRDGSPYFYAFDILHLDGLDLRACPLLDRKKVLEGLAGWSEHLRYAQHLEGDPALLLAESRKLKLEGIICKRADAPYRGGRGASWLKIKSLRPGPLHHRPSWDNNKRRSVSQVKAGPKNLGRSPPESYGALLDLAFNRGPSFGFDGDRYTEMRAIRSDIEKRNFAEIPAHIRSMKRLIANYPGLVRRREMEAAAFEKGLNVQSISSGKLTDLGATQQ